jgi:hypothetical protein
MISLSNRFNQHCHGLYDGAVEHYFSFQGGFSRLPFEKYSLIS